MLYRCVTLFSGANIAASWAALRSLGEKGYLARAKELMETTLAMMQGVERIPVGNYEQTVGLKIVRSG